MPEFFGIDISFLRPTPDGLFKRKIEQYEKQIAPILNMALTTASPSGSYEKGREILDQGENEFGGDFHFANFTPEQLFANNYIRKQLQKAYRDAPYIHRHTFDSSSDTMIVSMEKVIQRMLEVQSNK